MAEPSHEQKLINYLLAVVSQTCNIAEQRRMPDFVPCRIKTPEALSHILAAGEHDCHTNVWGAIFVPLENDQRLGVYIHECEILELRTNTKKQLFERRQKEQER